MSKLRWGVAGVTLLSVGVLATPASAASRSVFKTRGKELSAVVTTCPADTPAGTQCEAWLVFASQNRITQNGTVDRQGALSADKFQLSFTGSGFDVAHVGGGTGTPSAFHVANTLATGTATGTIDFGCDPLATGCVASTVTISLQLTANAPANFFRDRSVSEFNGCRNINRSNARQRTADGSAVIDGVSLPTTAIGPFPSSIGTSGFTTIQRGSARRVPDRRRRRALVARVGGPAPSPPLVRSGSCPPSSSTGFPRPPTSGAASAPSSNAEDVIAVELPGFGTPRPDGFGATMDDYAAWLTGHLETLDQPIDLVGHDWGAGFTMRLVSLRADLVRSWVLDAAGFADPGFEWHDFAKIWQTPGDGEAFWEQQLALSTEERAAVFLAFGVPQEDAMAMGTAIDATMAGCILDLYRSATRGAGRVGAGLRRHPEARHGGGPERRPVPRRRVVATAGRAAGRAPRAQRLDGVGHWWMAQDPAAAAAMLESFWENDMLDLKITGGTSGRRNGRAGVLGRRRCP